MLIAINNQSSTITGLQISQANSTELMAEALNVVYQQAQTELNNIMNMMQGLNILYNDLSSSDLGDFFENYYKQYGNGWGSLPDGSDEVKGAYIWMVNFLGGVNSPNGYKGSGVTITNNNVNGDQTSAGAWNESGIGDSDVHDTDDWTIHFTIGSQSFDVTGNDFVSNFQSYLGLAQSEYTTEQTSFSNLEQGDQTSLQDLQSGVQSTAQAGANLLSTGSSMIQAMGYTSSLLESPM
ncbi:hypothetical protein [Simkania negevensis]|nr:hypothetical protein [Simkania negevensis]